MLREEVSILIVKVLESEIMAEMLPVSDRYLQKYVDNVDLKNSLNSEAFFNKSLMTTSFHVRWGKTIRRKGYA